jgi:hypothetical protein
VPDDQKELCVMRGKYGLELVHAYALHFSNIPGIEENDIDGQNLVAQCIEGLMQIIEKVYVWLLLITIRQTHASDFPVLARIACDIVAIPGVSNSVEQLFSSSKNTHSDSQSSLMAESALKTVVTKKWLKKGLGLGDGVNYLEVEN